MKDHTNCSSFDMHFFKDRHGQLCVSTTEENGKKTSAVVDNKLFEDAYAIRKHLLALQKAR